MQHDRSATDLLLQLPEKRHHERGSFVRALLRFCVFAFVWCLLSVVLQDPNFPTDQGLTGLAWFSCKAEGAQYPINQTAMLPYPQPVAQLLRRAYYASVSFTDWNIGQLLGSLQASGAEKDTVVVMHADHGYQLGERNIWCKETCFNLATHVPLMIR